MTARFLPRTGSTAHVTTISMLADLAKAVRYPEASPILLALGLNKSEVEQSRQGAEYLVGNQPTLLRPPYDPNTAAARSAAVMATSEAGFNSDVRDGVEVLLSLADELMVWGRDPQDWAWMIYVFGYPFEKLLARWPLDLDGDTVKAIELPFTAYRLAIELRRKLEPEDPDWEEKKPELTDLFAMLRRKALLQSARRVRGMLSDHELEIFEQWASAAAGKALRLEF